MDGGTLGEVIRGAQRGEPASFDQLVDLFASRIFGFLFRITGSRDDAEDLMQEVFLRVVRMIGAYRHDDRFEAWIFRIAANLTRDRIRKASRAPRQVNTAVIGGADAESAAARETMNGLAGTTDTADARLVLEEDVDALNAALTLLSDAEREVIMLRHFAELSFKEIAELTGTPLGTALARAHRGLAKLREIMAGGAARGRVERRLL